MAQITDELVWNGDNVAALMRMHGITSRYALAKTVGMSRSVVSTAFDETWSGRATTQLVARLATHFKVPIGLLVTEPIVRLNGQHR